MLRLVARDEHSRRVRRLSVQGDLWLDLLRRLDRSRMLVADHIPDDARIVGITTDEALNTVTLYVESAEFEEVAECSPVPEWNLLFHEWYPRPGQNGELIFDPPKGQ